MIRIAIAGAVDAPHGKTFTGMINGYDPDGWKAAGFWEFGGRTVEGARVVKIWDPDRSKAEKLARLCGVEQVVSDLSDLSTGVDAIIVPDTLDLLHQHTAWPLLEAGLPTFVDKPLSPTVEEATALVEKARAHNTPLMTCSALRFAREIGEANLEQLGPIETATVAVRGELVFYGIHGAELAQAVMGPGVASVQNVGEEGREIAVLRYRDGRSIVLQVFQQIGYVLQLNAYGQKGWAQITTADSKAFYTNMLRRFVLMAIDRRPPIPYEDSLEVIKTLVAARRSRLEGGARIAI